MEGISTVSVTVRDAGQSGHNEQSEDDEKLHLTVEVRL